MRDIPALPASRPYTIGHVGGVPVVIQSSTLLLGLGLAAAWFPAVQSAAHNTFVASLLIALTVGAVLLSILGHELAHGGVGRLLGLRPTRYELYLWGGATSFAPTHAWAPWKDILTSLAGPLTNLTIWLAFTRFIEAVTLPRPIALLLWMVATVNLGLGLFNLMPSVPLDGGHALRALIWQLSHRPSWAYRGVALTGFFSLAIAAWCFLLEPFLAGYRINALRVVLLIVIGYSLATGSWSQWHSARMMSDAERPTSLHHARPEATISAALIVALAVQNAVPPFATDMYSPAFPQVAEQLSTTSARVGLTLTAFFIGMAVGQILGGSFSDHLGRRRPMIVGGLICALGSVMCALAPSVAILMLGRLLQGLGGGAASVVGRAVLVDLAHGRTLASILSILMAVSALAPMIAPIAGGLVLTVGTWRTVFWCLVAFGLFMTLMAYIFVPESLSEDKRQSGGLKRLMTGARELTRHHAYMGYMATSAFSGFAMFAYISSASFIMQEMKGLSSLSFSLFFAGTATAQMLLAILNSRLVRRMSPRRLIAVGLSLSALGVLTLALTILVFDVALVPLSLGFLLVMAAQAFVFGNSAASALTLVPGMAGVASAFLGVAQALANGISSPLASSGGGQSAMPMLTVMVVGISGAWISYLLTGRSPEVRAQSKPSLSD